MYTRREIKINNVTIDVIYTFIEGESEVYTEPNGDPGTPGFPPGVEIQEAWVELSNDRGGTSVVNILQFIDMGIALFDIEEKLLEDHEI
jgi:hypothetical protein